MAMADLDLAEEQIVTPVSREALIDALSPGHVADFLERHPGRAREFFVTADGRVVSASPGSRQTTPVDESEIVVYARRLRKHRLDLHA
jgi:hypothetical protein